MEKSIWFLVVSIILPSVSILVVLTQFVYVIGEYIQHIKITPRIFYLLGFEIALFVLLEMHNYHYFFQDCILPNFEAFSFIIGCYVVINMIMLVFLIRSYNRVLNIQIKTGKTLNFNYKLKKISKNTLERRHFFLPITFAIAFILFIGTLYNNIVYYSLFNFSVLVLVISALTVKIKLIHTFKTV